MTTKKIYKPKAISGYPEWLPEVRRVEQQWLDHIRSVFESYGFCKNYTPAVDELEVIAAKGEDVDKEIYVLERLQKEDGDKEARLALHFDQTVPLARYVGQHFNELVFPFKRYQMQKVWRGERPQSGRFREFYQCDIDVINVDHLPLSFDAEMPAIIHEVLSGLDIPPFQIRISNRKILMGFLAGLNIPHRDGGTHKISKELQTEIIRDIDKLEKIGKQTLLARLDETCLQAGYGFNVQTMIKPFLNIAEIKIKSGDDILELFRSNEHVDSSNALLLEGIEELQFVMDQLSHLPNVVADLSIVRGLDYYTGTVYETVFVDDPGYGSICSGGRYDDLASSYINKSLPGVGISIGFSRLFAKMVPQLEASRISPADVLVILNSQEDRPLAAETAKALRANGNKVELYHAPQKFSKQIAYAEKKGIPYVWFPPSENGAAHEVKNMASGEQVEAKPDDWKA